MVVRTTQLVWVLALCSLIVAALTPAQVTATHGVGPRVAAAGAAPITPSTATIAGTTTLLVSPLTTLTLTASVPPSLATSTALTGSATAAPSASPSTASVTATATVPATATAPVTASATTTATDTVTTAATATDTVTTAATAIMTVTTPVTATPTAIVPLPSSTVPAPQATWPKAPLAFEPNQGQSAAQVAFLAHGPGYTLFLGATVATLAALRVSPPITASADLPMTRVQLAPITATDEDVIRLHYLGANPAAVMSGQDQRAGIVNYLTGADPHGWHTSLPTYGRVTVQNVYPGINHVYYRQNGRLEDDWQVAAGANPGQIAFTVAGARGLPPDAQGNLALDTAFGPLIAHAPVAYQEIGGQRHSVAVHYTLTGVNQIGFMLGAYDPSQPLVIDPVLSYATYLGGSGDEEATSIAVDAAGNAYVAGSTISPNFPTTTGVLSGTLAGSYDAYVTKIAAGGGALVYSTYLGGSGMDSADSIAVDIAGNVYVAGSTASTDFPTTPGAYARSYDGGGDDAFVTRLNADGSALVYSTYLGGSGGEGASAIAVDSSGDAYVAGGTNSSNFPTTTGAYSQTLAGSDDAFVTKLTADGSALIYSTYLGGSGSDEASGIAVDTAGNVAVTGYTASTNFPTTAGAYAATNAGGTDAFVAKLNAAGSALVYSTYLGGSGTDVAHAIALDGTGAVYVAGQTDSTDFPTTPGAYATTNVGRYDAFVAKFTADGHALMYSTYLGGPLNEYGYGLAVDADGHAIVTGETQSTTYPTFQALQPVNGSQAARTCLPNVTPCTDAFVTELNAPGTGLVYSSYLGGNYDDVGEAIALDANGGAYVTGNTASTNFPTVNAVQNTLNDGTTCTQSPCNDAFVASITPAQTCPPGWQCDDIGSASQPGDQALTNGTWTIYGTGTDITGTVDQFHYVSQNVTGDSSIVARLVTQQNTGGCAKAGLMYRASTDPSDVNYSVVVTPACNAAAPGLQVTSRAAFSSTTTTAVSVPATLPVYLKITRSGNTFTASTSTDGVSWTPIANSRVSLPNMPNTALLGFATTSGSSTASSAATFDQVNLSGTVDLAQLDTETAHYTQTIGLTTTNLQLFGGQAGVVDANGWQPISLTLGISPATGMLAPATVPFGCRSRRRRNSQHWPH